MAMELLNPMLKDVINSLGYKKLLPIQEKAIPVILRGNHTLIISPTGSGKTEAAFLPVVSLILDKNHEKGIKAIYVTPLRALNRDISYRIDKIVTGVGLSLLLRHGDTSQSQRKKFLENPPDVMVTTPESLNLLLTVRKNLWNNVSYVIIDEIHELLDNKRGVELSLILERLDEFSRNRIQRIGLSATLSEKSKKEAMGLLAYNRKVEIVEDYSMKKYDISVMITNGKDEKWDNMIKGITNIIKENKGSILIFTNTRSVAEKLSKDLSKYMENEIGVHHGSLSKDVREKAEMMFREGKIKTLVATSSMELGIDIGKIDTVIQFMSPRQIITMLQRAGRSGHRIGDVSKGIIITMNNLFEIMESGVIALRTERGEIEDLILPKRSMDALAHQLVAMIVEGTSNDIDQLLSIVNRAYPFSTITYEDMKRVLDHLDSIKIIKFNEETKTITQSRRTRKYLYTVSMIPDEVNFNVYDISSNSKIGEVSERFVETAVLEEGKENFRFTLAGKVWEVISIDYEEEKIEAKPIAIDEGAIPVWEGELIPVSYNVAREVCSLISLGMVDSKGLEELLKKRKIPDEAILKVKEVLNNTKKAWGVDISPQNLVIEEVNGGSILYVCLGSKGNFLLALILSKLLEKYIKVQIDYIPYAIIFTSQLKVSAELIREALMELKNMDPPEIMALSQDAVKSSRAYISRFLQIAKRLGVVDTDVKIPLEFGKKLIDAYKNTVVDEETIREIIYDMFDLESLLKFKEEFSKVNIIKLPEPTPLAKEVLSNPYLRKDLGTNLKSLAIDYIIEGLRKNALNKEAAFVCVACGESWVSKVKDLNNTVRCPKCKAMMVAPMPNSDWGNNAISLFKQWKKGELKRLTQEQKKIINEIKDRAALYINYASQGLGRYVIEALMTQGVGPKATRRVIDAYIRGGEKEFYKALLKAKEDYISYKKYWD
ncbi:Lhr-like helicase [Caldisphaera lagunensis DSM 15908]|uniref:Lhr-like helicase n=1 Tax=Caldisphaera lagunensis (strain DSM 15908 / JCM 11604 / ANMR 0165 / IC-154) TaxID=1056495 RepID=L0ACR9_CALLD|nr:DEAD/DEAH box helicase [Caldisphaera lagunensis]AFZ70942.1 Lhr-like helicase [Caldisphaera lagunensis DSM 15908]